MEMVLEDWDEGGVVAVGGEEFLVASCGVDFVLRSRMGVADEDEKAYEGEVVIFFDGRLLDC